MRSENVLALSFPNCIPNCSDRVQLKFNANPRKAERNQWKWVVGAPGLEPGTR